MVRTQLNDRDRFWLQQIDRRCPNCPSSVKILNFNVGFAVECESCGYRSKELQTTEDLIRDHNKRVLAPIKEPEKIVYCISSPVGGFVKTYGIDRIENNVCIRLATFKNLESAKIFAKELGFPFKENDNG